MRIGRVQPVALLAGACDHRVRLALCESLHFGPAALLCTPYLGLGLVTPWNDHHVPAQLPLMVFLMSFVSVKRHTLMVCLGTLVRVSDEMLGPITRDVRRPCERCLSPQLPLRTPRAPSSAAIGLPQFSLLIGFLGSVGQNPSFPSVDFTLLFLRLACLGLVSRRMCFLLSAGAAGGNRAPSWLQQIQGFGTFYIPSGGGWSLVVVYRFVVTPFVQLRC